MVAFCQKIQITATKFETQAHLSEVFADHAVELRMQGT